MTIASVFKRQTRTPLPDLLPGLLPGLLTTAIGAAILAFATPARAGEGHDHGDAAAATVAAALPRFAAESEQFELVGVLSGRQLTLYLDHAASNAPVQNGRLDLEIGGVRHVATRHGDGEFELTLAEAPQAGLTPITATIAVADATDLLVGALDIHADAHADEDHVHGWQERALWGAGGVAVLLALAAAGLMARRLWAGIVLRRGVAA